MSKFITAFDTENESHVRWLKRMVTSSAKDYFQVLKENPMGIEVETRDVLDWAQTVFVLCTKYTKNLFDGHAVTIYN